METYVQGIQTDHLVQQKGLRGQARHAGQGGNPAVRAVLLLEVQATRRPLAPEEQVCSFRLVLHIGQGVAVCGLQGLRCPRELDWHPTQRARKGRLATLQAEDTLLLG